MNIKTFYNYLKDSTYPLIKSRVQILYSINTNHIGYLPQFHEILSFKEQEMAQSLKFRKLQKAYIIRHGILRLLLSHYIQKEPQKIEFKYNIYDKPLLNMGSVKVHIQFNISYTANYNLYAFALDDPIGVDIEKSVKETVIDDHAKEFMSVVEYDYFSSLDKREREEYFFTIWTRKEALIKSIGKGFSCDVQNISVHAPVKEHRITVIENLLPYQIQSFKINSHYFSALCVQSLDEYDWSLTDINS